MLKKQKWLKKANSILEYGIIIAIVVAAVAAMNHFIRRTSQGNIKRLSDATIGDYSDRLVLPQMDREGAQEEHGKQNRLSSTKLENPGGNTFTITNEQENFHNLSVKEDDPDTASILDVVDYAVKPVGFGYPNASYIFWDMHWPRAE